MEDNMDVENNEKLPVEKVIIKEDQYGSNAFVHIVVESEDVNSLAIAPVAPSCIKPEEDEERWEHSTGSTARCLNNGPLDNDDDASLNDTSHGISRSSSLDDTSTVTGSDIGVSDSLPSSPVPPIVGVAASPVPPVLQLVQQQQQQQRPQTPTPQPASSSPRSTRTSQTAATISPILSVVASTSTLPWGARKEKMLFPVGIHIDPDVKPGEFVMRTLFAEFTVLVDKKLEAVMGEPLERPLSKSLQRGEDPVFDQLLSAFGSVAEHCLPSLLRTLFAWYDRQGLESTLAEQRHKTDSKGKSDIPEKTEKDYLHERRDLAVEFIFCLVLVEVLKQLAVHPGHEGLVGFVENLAFKHFRFREGVQSGPNSPNYHIIADLYAEVIGVLAQSRFQSVRKRFTCELKELRAKELNPVTTQSIISLLMGMKFFRIKMVPIEEFEASFQFMQECAQYFLEVKDKDIKHALAGLFVETLVPVAAAVKNEVNVPVLKNFVEMLYPQTLDMATKKKHCLALFPLVTCLLCVSQKIFFLQNWHYFLAMCLSHLKNRDPKMSRVALESLYRLLWVYMIRIKCESNSATQSRLHSIVNSLFPKGSKGVIPRDTPLNIFVKIIQFIAQERLDFAMKEIVCDLLSVGRPIKMILTPERMSIGLRAFLVVADSLQQKEGDPPMPRTIGVLPSGSTLRIKKTFLNKMLSEDTAKSIGISSYYPFVRKAFDDILKALDVQFGRPLMMTNMQNVNKEPDEMITGERKPKIDLFRTCVAAIPRLMPDCTSRHDLVDMLARLTVHLDEELKGLAFQSLQNIIVDFPNWRDDVLNGFVQLLLKEVTDTFPQLFDNGLRMLLQLLTTWKNALTIQSQTRKDSMAEIQLTQSLSPPANQQPKVEAPASSINVLRFVEGFALVVLCNCRLPPRRLAVHILKEAKTILKSITTGTTKDDEQAVIDIMDRACPTVVERCVSILPASEKAALLLASNVDLQWLSDRSSVVWTSSSFPDASSEGSAKSLAAIHTLGGIDAWFLCLAGFLEQDQLLSKCPSAVAHSWPIVFTRLNALFTVVDPNPINDNRASLLRSSVATKKPVNERDIYLGLWRNYSMFACRVVPANCQNLVVRCTSPDLSLSSSPDSLASDRSESRSPNSTTVSTTAFYKLLIPLIRCESVDIRDLVVLALGRINHEAIKDLMEELVVYIKEAIDRKQENMRRRRRRDALRSQLARVFELIAEQGTFGSSPSVLDRDVVSLHPTFVEYIDGARLFLDGDQEKDVPLLQEIKGHFCGFIRKLIDSFQLENRASLLTRDLRRNLFNLFSGWSGKFGVIGSSCSDKRLLNEELCTDSEMSSLQAMSAVACCGPMFDQQGLVAEDGYMYAWLHMLLSCRDPGVYHLAQETLVLLLEFNPDVGALLEWVVDCCYTGENEVADACFTTLAVIFSAREYPCDHYTAIINVTLMNTGCPRANIHEMALQLLQILDKRFFGSPVPVVTDLLEGNILADERSRANDDNTLDVLLSTTYSRSQMFLSKELAQLHPELTMPMFSEITHRFQTARSPVQQLLLQYLLPWLYNMELVDPHIPPTNPVSQFLTIMQEYYPNEGGKLALRKEGWGSAEATEMILNNLFYVTTKFVDGHPKEIEELWTALCACWPGNLRIILRYLFIVSGMAPNELLSSAKKVVLFMGRSRPERLVDELMNELQTVETLNCVIERTETPPFFRVTNVRKTSSHSDTTSGGMPADVASRSELPVEEGTIHTKRHSAEDPSQKDGVVGKPASSGHGSLRSTCSISSGGSCKADGKFMMAPANALNSVAVDGAQSDMVVEDNFVILRRQGEEKSDTPLPHPLPMPEYGGYFAPLTEFLPNSSQPISGFHRCNLAVMLLTDVIVDGLDVDWSVHVPLMLHIVFLGLDNSRPLVYEHCKKLLLHLLIIMTAHDDHFTIARILLNNMTRQQSFGLQPPNLSIMVGNFTDPGFDLESVCRMDDSAKVTTAAATISIVVPVVGASSCSESESSGGQGQRSRSTSGDTVVTIVTDSLSGTCSPIPPDHCAVTKSHVNTENMVKALVDFIASRKSLPMWNYEDITARLWSIRSADHLATFLYYVLFVFKDSLPQAHIEERWAQISLQLALSCSSRHYAGRSLQIFRALGVPVTPRMLSEILSRLVETVAEQGEDMQGYVTEIMLTLEAAVDSLDSDFHPIDFVKELFKSTPNLNKDNRKSAPSLPASQSYHGQGPAQPGHTRSTSYSVTFCTRKPTATTSGGSPTAEIKVLEMRNRSSMDVDSRAKSTNLSRSRSAQSLKMMADQSVLDDKMAVLSQLFWIGVSLLESDYEYEFLLAMRLLEKVLKRLPLDRPDCREKVDKLHMQLRWTNFPGVHALLLKGLTSPSTYEPTLSILSRFTLLLDVPVVDPSQSIGFPFNVIALLPYMLQNYEDPNPICTQSAENIAQVCLGKSKTLENLATVMTLYSRRTFSKESFQWTKCVVKYLFDSYSHHSLAMMAFLVEILEKGPGGAQASILSIIHCMLHYLDMNLAAAQPINADLLRVIAKYVEGPHWKEALKILKLAVTRSSTLVVPPSSSTSSNSSSSFGFPANYTDTTSLGSHTSFAEAEVFTKKELPGRTMEFSFDLSQTPIIGRRYQVKQHQQHQSISSASSASILSEMNPSSDGKLAAKLTGIASLGGFDASSQRSASITQSLTTVEPGTVSGWRRPWASQARTRECLVNLLTSCGQRVGLPKSPSVIFSQSSDIVDRQSSKCSSTEEVSVVNNDMSLDSKVDDSTTTTDQQFGVFKDFDFLEYELESQEGESLDNFNWGVRRRSLSNLEGAEPTSIQENSLKGSAPNLVVRKEESSDDEMTSTSPMDDARTEELTPSAISLMFHPSSLPILDRDQHHSSPTSGSSHSICSDPDVGDLQTSNNSSHFSNVSGSAGCGGSGSGSGGVIGGGTGHSGGYSANTSAMAAEGESILRQHLHAFLSDSSGSLLPQTYLVFARAFREIRQRFVSLTQECCHYLTVLDAPRSVSSQFLNMVDVIGGVECPLVYVDLETVVTCNLFERLRFCVLELQEHLDTFSEKREHTLQCLEGITSSLKMQVMNESLSEVTSEDLQLDLCRCLFKVHFQLLLLFDCFYKMVGLLTSAAENSQVNNMTREMGNMRLELIRASEENDGDLLSSQCPLQQQQKPACPPQAPSEGRESTWHDAEHALLDLLHSRKWGKAVRLFQNCRNLFPTDSNEDEDVDIILSLYCKFLCERQSGVMIITHMDHDLAEVYSHLMGVNVQLSASVRQLERSAARTTTDRLTGSGGGRGAAALAMAAVAAEVTVRKTEC